MRHLILLFAVAVSLAAQEQPPAGNPNHEKPPDGWFCHTSSPVAPAPEGHECICHEHRTCSKDAETGQRVIVESPTCRVYCFKDNCLCAVKCEDTE